MHLPTSLELGRDLLPSGSVALVIVPTSNSSTCLRTDFVTKFVKVWCCHVLRKNVTLGPVSFIYTYTLIKDKDNLKTKIRHKNFWVLHNHLVSGDKPLVKRLPIFLSNVTSSDPPPPNLYDLLHTPRILTNSWWTWGQPPSLPSHLWVEHRLSTSWVYLLYYPVYVFSPERWSRWMKFRFTNRNSFSFARSSLEPIHSCKEISSF